MLVSAGAAQADFSAVAGRQFSGVEKGKAVTAALSKKTLQLLHSNAHGKFRTKGRYAAATVRGTIWTIADRCDGTQTHAIKDTVTVSDFVLHKTIILHAGHSYLALAKPPTSAGNSSENGIGAGCLGAITPLLGRAWDPPRAHQLSATS